MVKREFKEGEEVIAVHDVPQYDIKQGDILVVEIPKTPCCGGVIMQGKPHHMPPEHFESMNRPIVVGGVDKEEFLRGLNRLFQLPLMAASQGFISIEAYRKEIYHFLERMGVSEDFKNKYE